MGGLAVSQVGLIRQASPEAAAVIHLTLAMPQVVVVVARAAMQVLAVREVTLVTLSAVPALLVQAAQAAAVAVGLHRVRVKAHLGG